MFARREVDLRGVRAGSAVTSLLVLLFAVASGRIASAQFGPGDVLVVDDSSQACVDDNGAVFRVDAATGQMSLFACPTEGSPDAVAVSPDGRIFINGAGNPPCSLGQVPLFEVSSSGVVSLATCSSTNTWDELTIDANGRLLVLDTSHNQCGTFRGAVFEFDLQTFGQTGGPWCSASWFNPNSIAVDSDGTVLVATTVQGGTAELYRIDRTTGGVSLVGDLTGTFIAAQLAVGQDGRILLTDWSGPPGCLRADVKQVNGSTGVTSSLGCIGDMWFPNGILEGPGGDLFIADRDSQICDSGGPTNSGTVWRVSPSTVAEITHYCHTDSFNPHEIAWYPIRFDVFADGFESGNTTAWSSTVP